VNVAALIPHGAVRNAVLGLATRPPTATELSRMRAIVGDALDAGAAGVSTGLEYQPGCNAQPAEIEALVEEVVERDGVYTTHIRNRAERFADAVREAIAVARRSGARLQISHVAPRPYAPRAQTETSFDEIERARSEGVELWVDTFPEMWGPGTLADLFPPDVTEGAPAQVLRSLRKQATRQAVTDYFARGDNFLVRAGGFDRIYVSSSPARRELHGQSLADLASSTGKPVAELATDLLIEAGESFMSLGIRHVYATEDDLRRVLRLPYCSLGSDGVVVSGEGAACAFPWSASSYGYTARTLGHYAREVGLFSLEEAVRRLAALPAEALGLRDRGVLREGAAADLVVFDPLGIRDLTTPEDMARHPEGVRHVMVNGSPVIADEASTGARPGRLVAAR
jgi:N-acyl-D-amino-acid deacylase